MKNTLKTLLITAFYLLMPALATVALAQTPTTQTLAILGGSGIQGKLDTNTEYYNPYLGIWQSAYLSGNHPWGFISGTNSWLNYKADSASDSGCNDINNQCKYLYRVRFSVPATWTNPTMTVQLQADNSADVRFNGSPVAFFENEGATVNGNLVFSSALQAGVNTITFEVGDWGGYNGFNYRIDLSMVASSPMVLIPATPAPPPPGPPVVDPNTKYLTILGGTGAIGATDLYTEYYNPTTSVWQQAPLAGVHPWGLLPGTSSWINYRQGLDSDIGCTDINNPCKYQYRVRFTVPPTWTNAKMALQFRVDNTAKVSLNNTQIAFVTGQGDPLNADLLFASAVIPGTNTLTFEVGDYGSLNGFNYRIDLSVVSTTGSLGLISGTAPPPPPPPPTIDPNTKYLTILGTTGTIGQYDTYAEYFNPYTQAWQPAYVAGVHPWGVLAGTTSWLNFRPTLTSEDGCVDPNNPCKYLYRVRFTAPAAWTNPKMTLQLKVDNTADVRLNNTPVAYVEGQGDPLNADLVFSSSLLPGTNTLTFEVGDYGSFNGFDFRIDLSVVSTSGSFALIPAPQPPVIPPSGGGGSGGGGTTLPTVKTMDQCDSDGWKKVARADGTVFKSQGECQAYVLALNPLPTVKTEDQCKNYGWKKVTRADGTLFKNQGDCVSYVQSITPKPVVKTKYQCDDGGWKKVTRADGTLFKSESECDAYVVSITPKPTVKTDDQCKYDGWKKVARADGTVFTSQSDCLAYLDSLKPKVPTTEDQCKSNGWAALRKVDGSKFKSEADCTAYVAIMKKVPTKDDQCKNNGWKNLNKPDGTKFKSQSDCLDYLDDCDDDDDKYGYDWYGYDKHGYSKSGYDHDGYDKDGYDKDGYGKDGCDKYGYNKSGYDKDGYNKYGYNKYGKKRS